MAKASIKQAAKKIAIHKKVNKPVTNAAIASPQPEGIIAIAENKAFKAKEKVVQISGLLLNNNVSIDELLQIAASQKDVTKGTLVEAMEFASKEKPELINEQAFEFVIRSLKEGAPRVKLEAAKVISNTA